MKELVLYNRYGYVFKESIDFWNKDETLVQEVDIDKDIKVFFSLEDTLCKVIYDDKYDEEGVLSRFKKHFEIE